MLSAASLSVTLASDDAAVTALSAIETSAAAGATAANQAAANTSLETIANAQGAGGTGIAEPTGGSGLLGWLSGIYRALINTLAVADANTASVPGRIALTVGTPATAGRSFAAICSVAGNVSVTFADTSVGTYPLSVGVNVFPFQVTEVNSVGTTATATYENWK
ncbi:hypothetical protein [Paraburkholderia sediminicola]|uniref:hypothetical protein n=1 Tax=Paraburkholderia sediminicola TaxID=458836 RepID=UPI0038BA32B2